MTKSSPSTPTSLLRPDPAAQGRQGITFPNPPDIPLDSALPGIPDADPPLVGGLTVTGETLILTGTVQGTSSSTSSWPASSRKACRCRSASRFRTARSPRRQARPGDQRRPLRRGVYAVVDAVNDYVKVIGDAFSASASSSQRLANSIIKAELYMFVLLLSKRNQTNESGCYAG